jgi:hypothetical protein
MEADRRKDLLERLDWLAAARARHQRMQKQSWYCLALALVAIPIQIVWGVAYSLWAVVVEISLTAMVFYVAWNHENECDAEADAIRTMLDAPEVEATSAASASAPAREAPVEKQRRKFDAVRQPRRLSL